MLERYRRRLAASLALPVLMGVAGLWTLAQLPPGTQVPIHFDGAGHANGWADARWGLFVLPALAAGMPALLWLLPLIDPRADKLRQSQGAQLNIALAVQLLLGALQVAAIAHALGHPPELPRAMPFMMGLLFAVIGNMAPKLRWNTTVGIRTPWTLTNERVWDRTHRFGGRLFFAGGVALMLAALSSGIARYGAALVTTLALGISALCVLKSWLVWREVTRGG